jgi:signal transduction histidine kinase
MTSPEPVPGTWSPLVEAAASLTEERRKEYIARLELFAHDLRQPLAQIHAAEDLLRRGLNRGGNRAELLELLDIIRTADRQAAALVTEFVEKYLQEIKATDQP